MPTNSVSRVQEDLFKIIVEHFGASKENVNLNSRFVEDLGGDSLDLVEFVMKLEEDFSIEIPDEDVEKIKTVGDVVSYIETKVAS